MNSRMVTTGFQLVVGNGLRFYINYLLFLVLYFAICGFKGKSVYWLMSLVRM